MNELEIKISTKKRFEVVDITEDVERIISKQYGNVSGICFVFCPHVTAAITLNEHDEELWLDFIENYQRLVPIKGKYHHNEKYSGWEREQNAHAHILNTLIGHSVMVPVMNGKLMLGTWQSILFIEMDGPRERKVRIFLLREKQ